MKFLKQFKIIKYYKKLFIIILSLSTIATNVLAIPNANESRYNKLFYKFGKEFNIPPILLWAIAKTESNFTTNAKNINNRLWVDAD